MSDGRRIGRYLAEKALGAGSFATVWLAYDELLETRVAIKVLADNWARNPGVRQRFVDEARILRRIDHDRIVRVHEINELEDGRPYFVMALADRGTLHERLANRSPDDLLPVTTSLRLGIEICEALAVAHDFGVVHRDVKPSNILFRSVRTHERIAAQRAGKDIGDEAIMLGDFGLAKDLAAASGFTLAAGTPAYMAPEQAQPTAVIDRRVDVFALTAVVYEMLAGKPVFNSDTLSGVRRSRATTSPDRLSAHRKGLHPALDRIMETGLARSPDDRYPSVLALGAALEEVLAALSAPPPGFAAPTVRPASRLPLPPPPPPPPAQAPSSSSPVGAAGRVLDLLGSVRPRITSADGQRLIADAQARLARPLTVVVVGGGRPAATVAAYGLVGRSPSVPSGGSLGTMKVLTLDGGPGLDVVLVPSVEEAIVTTADVVVVIVPSDSPAPTEMVSHLSAVLRHAPAGPVALEALVDPVHGGAAPEQLAADLRNAPGVGALVPFADVLAPAGVNRIRAMVDELVGYRAPLIKAAAGLKLLSLAADGAASPAARAEILEGIDSLRAEIPTLVEVELLHDLTSGKAVLPAMLRADLRRLFLFAQPATRLGLPSGADPATLRATVEETGTRWRVLENTGRVPFSARRAMLVAQQSLDRLHAELDPYGA